MRRKSLVLLLAAPLCAAALWASGSPLPALTVNCPPPTTTCFSCLDFGHKASYQCTSFCVNGVPHRTCNTCGEGCLQ